MAPDWKAKSLALHTRSVIQGAFILAKATGGAEIAADSIDHLCRCIEMLFGVGTERTRHLTDGDSE
jgi:TetR/AcrR family transcriptional regulator, transcriptional repressor for nem operon